MISKQKIAAVLLICLAIYPGASAFANGAQSHDEQQAQEVVSRYLSALQQGDTSTIKELLGGELLEKRAPLLNNPNYPAMLTRIYEGARMALGESRLGGVGDVLVDATITLQTQEVIRARFRVRATGQASDPDARFVIVAEEEPEARK